MSRYWIVVASADHVARGRRGGFVQACHGKRAPLQRMTAGDLVACYSPTGTFRGKDRLRAFTAFGEIADGDPYQVEMAPGFKAWRRDVTWLSEKRASIEPMLGELELAGGGRNWGYQLRFGIVSVIESDMERIATAMGVTAVATHCSFGRLKVEATC